ncbi:MAG: prepilin-type N-terminal cleavage/methylation domain-containing protein [Opitutaceae bacterium]|jgi:prepilin-type N-terminal cleavage/methylation domain-containing protein/prepilin-type processing-associated H-X9-DG protein|nr:prepilin-type N-terminal cleavage/methylation domain-containing protein [Opitutaceae bacterium]
MKTTLRGFYAHTLDERARNFRFPIPDFRLIEPSHPSPRRRGSAQSGIRNRESKISRGGCGGCGGCGAFTLVELLTVIAIIGILAAIMIPTVGRVRETARLIDCTSNLRALHTGFTLFANDHRGKFPAPMANPLPAPPAPPGDTGSWMLALQYNGYLDNKNEVQQKGRKNIFLCPAALKTWPDGGAKRTYLMVSLTPGQEVPHAIDPPALSAPSRSLLLIDGKDSGAGNGDTWPSFKNHPGHETRIDYRHNAVANALFVDGHIEKLAATDPNLPDYIDNVNR